jgi:hypothetical protein
LTQAEINRFFFLIGRLAGTLAAGEEVVALAGKIVDELGAAQPDASIPVADGAAALLAQLPELQDKRVTLQQDAWGLWRMTWMGDQWATGRTDWEALARGLLRSLPS